MLYVIGEKQYVIKRKKEKKYDDYMRNVAHSDYIYTLHIHKLSWNRHCTVAPTSKTLLCLYIVIMNPHLQILINNFIEFHRAHSLPEN